MKLCIDCKYYREHDHPQCGHKEAERTDPINGKRLPNYSCFAMRGGICKEGRFFEQRTCECGATIARDELTCSSCAAMYRAESEAELDRKFPRSEP